METPTAEHDEAVGLVPFVRIPDWVLDLGARQFIVFASISTFTDNATRRGYPSIPAIAARAGVSESSVIRASKILEAEGAMTVTKRRRKDGGSYVNLYDVTPAFIKRGGVTETPGGVQEGHRGGVSQPPELEPEELEGVEGEGSSSSLTLSPARSAALASAGAREAERLCVELADAIEANGCKRPTITKAWLSEARLLVDKDLRHPDDVSKAIAWATSHAFWKANILSMPKLREKYDTLRLRAQHENAMGNGKSLSERRYDDAQSSLRVAMDRVQAGGVL